MTAVGELAKAATRGDTCADPANTGRNRAFALPEIDGVATVVIPRMVADGNGGEDGDYEPRRDARNPVWRPTPGIDGVLGKATSKDEGRARGAQRVIQVAERVGMDNVEAFEFGLDQRAADMKLKNGNIIEVGGKSKGGQSFANQLRDYARYESRGNGKAYFVYFDGTTQEAVDTANGILGKGRAIHISKAEEVLR